MEEQLNIQGSINSETESNCNNVVEHKSDILQSIESENAIYEESVVEDNIESMNENEENLMTVQTSDIQQSVPKEKNICKEMDEKASTYDCSLANVSMGQSSNSVYCDEEGIKNYIEDQSNFEENASNTDDQCYTIEDTSSNVSNEKKNQEKDLEQQLPFELSLGYRILKSLMLESNKYINWPFMDPVDDSKPATSDYYEKIKNPIWILKMKEKFENGEYKCISEFVKDIRQMIENALIYNGPDHYISKRAKKLEVIVEQKIAVLPKSVRELIMKSTLKDSEENDIAVEAGLRRRHKRYVPHSSDSLINQLREATRRERTEQRKQAIKERKAQQEAFEKEALDWEEDLLKGQEEYIKAMWELPQIGHFLFLVQDALNIDEVPQYELERCFLMPRQSSTLARIMTSLLCSVPQRSKITYRCVMNYSTWNRHLCTRLSQWFKVLQDCKNNTAKAAFKLGIDERFFKIFGEENLLERCKFHHIQVYRRVWVVKSLCDYCLEHQRSVQEALETQPIEEQHDYYLGTDAEGNSYLHFPQFCGPDLRVYKQAKIIMPKIVIEEEKEVEKITPKKKRGKGSNKASKPRRPSRLRQMIKTILPTDGDAESSSDDSEPSDTEADTKSLNGIDSDVSQSSRKRKIPTQEYDSDESGDSKLSSKKSSVETDVDDEAKKSLSVSKKHGKRINNDLRMGLFKSLKSNMNLFDENSIDRDDAMSDTSYQMEVESVQGDESSTMEADSSIGGKTTPKDQLMVDTVSESEKSLPWLDENSIDSGCSSDNSMAVNSKKLDLKDAVKNDSQESLDSSANNEKEEKDEDDDTTLSASHDHDYFVSGLQTPINPILGEFEMVVDSVQGLRELMQKFEEKTVTSPRKGKGKSSSVVKKQPRKKCVADLYNRLQFLYNELLPWEQKLVQARKKALNKIFREFKDYPMGKEFDLWEKNEEKEEASGESSGTESADDTDDEKQQTKAEDVEKPTPTEHPDINKETFEEYDISSRGRLRKRRVQMDDSPAKRKKVENMPSIVTSINGVYKQLYVQGAVVASSEPSVKTSESDKQASHPMIQQLLSAPKTSEPGQGNNLGAPKVQYYAANINSLPPSVIEHLVRSNALEFPAGTQKGMVLLTVNEKGQVTLASGSHGKILTLPLSFQVPSSQNKPTLSPRTTITGAPQLPIVNPHAPIVPKPNAQLRNILPLVRTPTVSGSGDGKSTGKKLPESIAGLITANASISHVNTNQNAVQPQVVASASQSPASIADTCGTSSNDTGTKKEAVTPQGYIVRNIHCQETFNFNAANLTNGDQLSQPDTPAVSSPATTSVTKHRPLLPAPPSTTQQMSSILMSHPRTLPAHTSPNRSTSKYANNVTVKYLLEAKKGDQKPGEKLVALPNKPQQDEILLDNIKTPDCKAPLSENIVKLHPEKELFHEPLTPTSKFTGMMTEYQFKKTTEGVKIIKIPSKEVLDSVVQAVVTTSVKTSLPTAIIKVPSPVTLPSIQPRKNVTKTIPSVKGPIATTPKVEALTVSSAGAMAKSVVKPGQGLMSKQASAGIMTHLNTSGNVPSKNSNLPGQSITVTKSKDGSVSQNILPPQTVPSSLTQTSALVKVVPPSSGVIQGYLTPQGYFIQMAVQQQGQQSLNMASIAPTNVVNKSISSPALNTTSATNVLPSVAPNSLPKAALEEKPVVLKTPGNLVSSSGNLTVVINPSLVGNTNPNVQNVFMMAPSNVKTPVQQQQQQPLGQASAALLNLGNFAANQATVLQHVKQEPSDIQSASVQPKPNVYVKKELKKELLSKIKQVPVENSLENVQIENSQNSLNSAPKSSVQIKTEPGKNPHPVANIGHISASTTGDKNPVVNKTTRTVIPVTGQFMNIGGKLIRIVSPVGMQSVAKNAVPSSLVQNGTTGNVQQSVPMTSSTKAQQVIIPHVQGGQLSSEIVKQLANAQSLLGQQSLTIKTENTVIQIPKKECKNQQNVIFPILNSQPQGPQTVLTQPSRLNTCILKPNSAPSGMANMVIRPSINPTQVVTLTQQQQQQQRPATPGVNVKNFMLTMDKGMLKVVPQSNMASVLQVASNASLAQQQLATAQGTRAQTVSSPLQLANTFALQSSSASVAKSLPSTLGSTSGCNGQAPVVHYAVKTTIPSVKSQASSFSVTHPSNYQGNVKVKEVSKVLHVSGAGFQPVTVKREPVDQRAIGEIDNKTVLKLPLDSHEQSIIHKSSGVDSQSEPKVFVGKTEDKEEAALNLLSLAQNKH